MNHKDSKINKIISSRYTLLFLFILSTTFFLFQHFKSVSWDFMAYSLNARYFIGNSEYFEWVRPPLTPFLISLFNIFTWKIAEYGYIIFVSTLHLFSCVCLSKRLKFNPTCFYILSINPFLLFNGVFVGTELLAISLFQLMIAYLDYSGIFLALLFLTRYPTIIFSPVILFLKNHKKIIKNIIFFCLIAGIWFLFNYIKTGNPLTSMLDIYAKDIKSGSYHTMPFNFLDILKVGLYLIPLALFGLLKKIKKIKEMNKFDYIMILILFLVIFQYYSIPFKSARYLFLLLLPLIYFSMLFIKDSKYVKPIIFIILLFNIISIFYLFSILPTQENIYEEAISHLPDNCIVSSNAWVPVNYYGRPSTFAQRKELLNSTLNEGFRTIIFYDISEPDYSSNKTFLGQFPIIYEDDDYIILGYENKCKKEIELDRTYLENLKETILLIHGYEIDTSTLSVIFGPSY